ncbi:MAG: LPS assembly lipoprotein LptE [Niabella sp.]
MTSRIYRKLKKIPGVVYAGFVFIILIVAFSQSGCGVYKFKDISIPDSIKVVKVNNIENKARYINPQLAPKLTDAVKRKIVSQSKLKQTNGDDADWEITASIRDYSFGTGGISNQRVTQNKLNVGVHIEVKSVKEGKVINQYDVSRSFPYDGTLSLQEAEKRLESDMLRDLSDDIFNRLFSNW